MANRPYILVYMDPLLTYLLASVPSLTQPKDHEIKVYAVFMFPTIDGRNPAPPGMYKPCKYWDKLHINWCRISSINSTKYEIPKSLSRLATG